MWNVTLRDLLYRKRRFAIGAAGAGLVFAMALTLGGLGEGFRVEARRTVGAVGADRWVMPAGGGGPFTSFTAVSEEAVALVADMPGVERADPLIVLRQAAILEGTPKDAVVIGYRIGGLGQPEPVEGAAPASPGGVVADRRLGAAVGDTLVVSGRSLRVEGLVDGFTMSAGIPNLYVPIEDVQALAFEGQAMATAIVTRGVPSSAPPGFVVLRNEQGIQDALRPLANGITSLDNSTMFLWVVAAIIIGTIVYLTTLERLRDFAVLKALGASSRDLFLGLTVQSVLVALVAVALAAVVAFLLVPLFPMPVSIPGRAYALLPVVAVGVGVLASTSGLRRAIKADPALAFGGP